MSNLEISAEGILELLWFVIMLPVITGLLALLLVMMMFAILAVPVLFIAAPVVIFYKLIEWGTL